MVQIEATYRCPNICIHCYNFWRSKDELAQTKLQDNLTMEEMDHIVDQLIRFEVFHVIMTGGEPLANKRVVFHGIKRLRQAGITVGINSTLIPLKPKDASFLKEIGVSGVLTSILGPDAESHDAITQKPGSFDKTIRGIKLLQEAGMAVTANMVVSQANLHLMEQTASLAKSMGMKSFCSTRAACPANCTDFRDLALSLDEFRTYLERLYNIGQELNLTVDALEGYPLCGIKEVNLLSEFTSRRCLAGVTSLTVGPDCLIRPCSHMDEVYGDLTTEDLDAIWAKMNQWRTGAMLPETCKTCELVAHCGGGCRMEAKMIKGSINAMDPYASPQDVPYTLTRLPVQKRTVEFNGMKSFRLNAQIRWRREDFGSIVFLGQRSTCYLNTASTAFLESLEVGQVYQVDDVVSKYGDGAREFLYGLRTKRVIVST